VTDAELLAKKLAAIETYVAELRSLGRPDEIAQDVVQQRFLLHTLQMAMQAALDAASHIVSDERLGEPVENRDVFLILGRRGWIDHELAGALAKMVGMRNRIVHGYDEVDLDKVRQALGEDLDDLLDLAEAIRRRLSETAGGPSAP
jgi:uncharacterized protein YutE (UPF0331/DUF86 family)